MHKILLFSLLSFLIYSCSNVTGSGNIITQKRSVKEFSSISASTGVEVEIRVGDHFAVEVEADDNVLEFLVTKVEDHTLKIRTRNVNLMNAHLKVYITAPSIGEIKASSSAHIEIIEVLKSTEKIKMITSSSATINANVDAPELVLEASSSSKITIGGRARIVRAEASSSGEIEAGTLLSEQTKADASSSGIVNVFASIKLDAHASSSGIVRYKGTAEVNSNTNSSGVVEKD